MHNAFLTAAIARYSTEPSRCPGPNSTACERRTAEPVRYLASPATMKS
jgi:hypothetical protein